MGCIYVYAASGGEPGGSMRDSTGPHPAEGHRASGARRRTGGMWEVDDDSLNAPLVGVRLLLQKATEDRTKCAASPLSLGTDVSSGYGATGAPLLVAFRARCSPALQAYNAS